MQKPKFSKLYWLYGLLIMITTCFMMGMVVLSIYWGFWQVEERLHNDADHIRNYINNRLVKNETVLNGFSALLKGQTATDINVVRAYTDIMLERFPQISMFQVAEYLDTRTAPSYHQYMMQQGINIPQVYSFAGAPRSVEDVLHTGTEALPVIFIAPMEPGSRLGLDLLSLEFIRNALPNRNHNYITLSEPFELFEGGLAVVMTQPIVQSSSNQAGFVALLVIKLEDLLPARMLDANQWAAVISVATQDNKGFDLLNTYHPHPTHMGFLYRNVEIENKFDFSDYRINLKLVRKVSWSDLQWQKPLIILLFALLMPGLFIVMYKLHIAVEASREQHRQELYRQANFDPLTGLPNRIHFEEQARRTLNAHARKGEHLALLFIDLNGFKAVNDTHGHAAGDKVLHAAGRALKSVMRKGDLAGRLGGDEFVVMVENVKDLGLLLRVMEKVRLVLNSLQINELPNHHCSASVGFAYTAIHGYDFEDLLKVADDSMYGEKQSYYQDKAVNA